MRFGSAANFRSSGKDSGHPRARPFSDDSGTRRLDASMTWWTWIISQGHAMRPSGRTRFSPWVAYLLPFSRDTGPVAWSMPWNQHCGHQWDSARFHPRNQATSPVTRAMKDSETVLTTRGQYGPGFWGLSWKRG